MSEARTDDALEAEALAAIEAADKPEAKVEAAPAKDDKPATEAKADPKTRLETTALTIGWSGKDEWKGDPADWLDAPEFILKAAGEVLPSMRKSLEKANDEIKGLKAAVKQSIAHMSKADERAYAKARGELEAELATYAEAGNVKAVKEVTDDLLALDREAAARPKPIDTPEEPPEFAKWREDNPWYGTDEAMSAACDAIGKKAFDEGYTGKAQIVEVDRRMREKFPGLYAKPTNPNRNGPAAVEGGTTVRRQGGKSFSDMPREFQDACNDMIKASNGKITKEGYAREYFAAQEQR
jgi:hypothetical protein